MASFHRARPYIDGDQSWKRMSLLTVSSFGTQFLWSAEMSQASPYLLSLGISKSQLSLVLMAGPLSGLFAQPIIGLYGDQNTHWLGRRRPFIILGCLSTVISLFAFGWSREIAQLFLDSGSESHERLLTLIAVVGFYALDISINVVTVSNKCLIVDVLPSAEQQLANAYGSRFSGISAILTMLMSLIDLPQLFNSTNTTQLKFISYFGIPIFLATHLVMCLSVHERPFSNMAINDSRPIIISSSSSSVTSLRSAFQKFLSTWNSLEGSIVKPICWIQLWAWIGWFPMLFYTTTWIGEIWARTNNLGSNAKDDEKATRIGTIGLLIESVLSLLGWVLIPRMVSNYRFKKYYSQSSTSKVSYDYGKTLVDLWAISQICFGFLLVLSPYLENNLALSICLIGVCGVPWAIASWVPSTLLGEAIVHKPELLNNLETNRSNHFKLLPTAEPNQNSPHSGLHLNGISPSSSNSKSTAEFPPVTGVGSSSPFIKSSSKSRRQQQDAKDIDRQNDQEEQDDEDDEELIDELIYGDLEEDASPESKLAGTILGIHNVFIVVPQLIITLISFLIFNVFEPLDPINAQSKKPERTSSIGWVFRVGGLASLVSAYFCWKLSRLIQTKFLS